MYARFNARMKKRDNACRQIKRLTWFIASLGTMVSASDILLMRLADISRNAESLWNLALTISRLVAHHK